ncbi:uncharacterized protein TNCV_382571 [Trichonephila clavipes]|nr:uncharacterized protein TNCV_382571 [Trichonephila clavipes]
MAPHRPQKSSHVEYATDEEDMIVYDMGEEWQYIRGIKKGYREIYGLTPRCGGVRYATDKTTNNCAFLLDNKHARLLRTGSKTLSVDGVSAADKGCRVYPLDPLPDAVALYSECTPSKRRAWILPDDRYTASLVGLRGGLRHDRTKLCPHTYGSNAAVLGLRTEICQTFKIRGYTDKNSVRFINYKSFLLANTFLESPVTISPHKSLNTFRVVISEPNLLSTPESEILEEFPDQGVIKKPENFNTSSIAIIRPQATKSSKLSATTQTDENITKLKCPPLKLLPRPSSLSKQNISPSIPSSSASPAQADLLTSTSPVVAIPESEPVNPPYTQQHLFHIQYIRFFIELRCSTVFCLYTGCFKKASTEDFNTGC